MQTFQSSFTSKQIENILRKGNNLNIPMSNNKMLLASIKQFMTENNNKTNIPKINKIKCSVCKIDNNMILFKSNLSKEI